MSREIEEEVSKLFCHYVWVSLDRNVDDLYDWLVENMGEPFYRSFEPTAPMHGSRWSVLGPFAGSISICTLRVHFADPKDALLFKLRWG